VTLAWDVVTASDGDATSHLVTMRDEALAMVDTLSFTVTSSTDTPSDPQRLREVIGTFQVPWYLSGTNKTSTLTLDASGRPSAGGLGNANFAVEIPQCATNAATLPLPVIVYGHGLFGSAQSDLDTGF